MRDLAQSGEYGTDKVHNGYAPAYDFHFGPLRDLPLTILELGVFTGGSLNLWAEYFPRATVVGVDINDPFVPLRDRVHFYRGDATDPRFLDEVVGRHPPDVVIDDASHFSSHMRRSFELLWERTRLIYVVEDIGTQFRDRHEGWYVDTEPFVADVLAECVGLFRHDPKCLRVCAEYGQAYLYRLPEVES